MSAGGWEINARIGADGTGFAQALNVAGRQGQEFANKLGHQTTEGLGELKNKFAAAFSVAAIEAAIHSTIQYASEIKNLAEQQQISTDEAQKFAIASKKVGLDTGDVGTGLRSLGKKRKEAAEGANAEGLEMRETFERFGITLTDLQNPLLRDVDLMLKLGEAIEKMNMNSSDREALGEMLGKAGPKLQALLRAMKEVREPLITPEEVTNLKHAAEIEEEIGRRSKVAIAGVIGNPKQLLGDLMTGGLWGIPLRLLQGFVGKPKASADHPIARDTGEFFGPEEPGKKREDLYPNKAKAAQEKRILELREKLHDATVRMGGPEALRADLNRKLEAVEKKIAQAGVLPSPVDEEGLLKLQLERQHIKGELQGIHGSAGPTMQHESLAKIGGSTENAGRVEPLLEQIRKHTATTALNTGRVGRAGGGSGGKGGRFPS